MADGGRAGKSDDSEVELFGVASHKEVELDQVRQRDGGRAEERR